MHPLLNIAVRAARRAGNIIARSVDHVDRIAVDNKSKNDYVSEVDRTAEREIIAEIHKAYPDHAILGEESGEQGVSDFRWIIDPLDGTTNFLHGFPHFAVSIACEHKGRIEHGVVYDPIRQELFTASRGGGAALNDRRLRVTKRVSLEGALIGTGFPFRQHQDLELYFKTFREIFPHTAGVRRAGSAALDLAYVAAGRMDGFWEFGLNKWDMAAGVLLVQEAGGLVGDALGNHLYMETGNVVAGAPKVFKGLLQSIRPHLPANMVG
jgi:myo-inositol-1(or 4)-monophosphatase